jgi:hypothetical protein
MEDEIEVIPEDQDARERCLIYSTECFSCPHAIAGANSDSIQKDCHYSRGNRYCPAAQVIFVVSGEAEAAILIEAAKLNEYARERFYAAVENPKILDAFNT